MGKDQTCTASARCPAPARAPLCACCGYGMLLCESPSSWPQHPLLCRPAFLPVYPAPAPPPRPPGADPNAPNPDFKSPLHLAASRGKPDLLRLLLDRWDRGFRRLEGYANKRGLQVDMVNDEGGGPRWARWE